MIVWQEDEFILRHLADKMYLPPLRRSNSTKCEMKCLTHSGAVCSLASHGLSERMDVRETQQMWACNWKLHSKWKTWKSEKKDKTIKQHGESWTKETFKLGPNESADKCSNVQTLKSESHYNLCKCLIICLGMKQYSVQIGFIILCNGCDSNVRT